MRPKLSYGAVVWAANIGTSRVAKLAKLQRIALVAMTQPLRSAPTRGLETMIGWIPLDLYVREIGLRTYSRVKPNVMETWNYIGLQQRMCCHLGLWNEDLITFSRMDRTPATGGEFLSAAHTYHYRCIQGRG